MQQSVAKLKGEVLFVAGPPCLPFMVLQNLGNGSSIPLESEERKVITARSHLIFAARQCIELMHRGDHLISKRFPLKDEVSQRRSGSRAKVQVQKWLDISSVSCARGRAHPGGHW